MQPAKINNNITTHNFTVVDNFVLFTGTHNIQGVSRNTEEHKKLKHLKAIAVTFHS